MQPFLSIVTKLLQKVITHIVIPVFLVRGRILVFYVAKKFTIHAEQSCIMNVKDKSVLRYCTLYLLKLNSSGNIVACCPCDMCDHILKKYKIRKVVCVSQI